MSSFLGNLLYLTPQSLTTNGVGENTNVSLASSLLLVTPQTDLDWISGFIPQQTPDGAVVWVMNVDTTKTLLFKSASNSFAGYQIVLPVGFGTMTLEPGDSALFEYSQGVGWRPFTMGNMT